MENVEQAFNALAKAKIAGKSITVEPRAGQGCECPVQRLAYGGCGLSVHYAGGRVDLGELDGVITAMSPTHIQFEARSGAGVIHIN